MPAPTALQRRPDDFADNVAMEAESVPLPTESDGDLISMSIDPVDAAHTAPEAPAEDMPMVDESGKPKFPAAKSIPLAFRREQRKVPIPPHRMTPLKNSWPKIYPPLVEHLKLQVRMNTKSKSVELRTSSATTDTGALQKGEDLYVRSQFRQTTPCLEQCSSLVRRMHADFSCSVKAFTLGFDTDDAIAVCPRNSA